MTNSQVPPPQPPAYAQSPVPQRRSRVPAERAEWVFYPTVAVVMTVVKALTRRTWFNLHNIPAQGGVVLVSNHVSNADPVVLGTFIRDAGRWPRWLAKDEIFAIPGIGWLARHTGQILVHRGSGDPRAVAEAVAAVGQGKCVVIYPEGTITADPQTWPMTAKSGSARIALTSGCQIIPVAQWGPNEILPGKKLTRPRLFPRKLMKIVAGTPIDLDDLRAQELSPEVLAEADRRIMAQLTEMVAQLRGETAPPQRWDPRVGRRVDYLPRGPVVR